jgi:hypothetical protein
MAISIQLDNGPTSTLQASGNASKVLIRGGRIKGLSGLAGAPQSNALLKAMEALSAVGVTLYPIGSAHPDDSSMVLTGLVIKGLPSFDATDVLLRYETPTGFPGTALIYETDSSLQPAQRDKYPGSNLPIFIGWQGRASAGGAEEPVSQVIALDTAPFAYLRPIIRVSATLIRAGFLDDTTTQANADSIGVVNDKPWMGRPIGSWLMTDYKSTVSRYAGTYSVRASAIRKKGEDWRVLDVLRSRTTGKIATPDSTKISQTLALPYKYGKIGVAEVIYTPKTDGMICHGPYQTADFPSLWSILIQ